MCSFCDGQYEDPDQTSPETELKDPADDGPEVAVIRSEHILRLEEILRNSLPKIIR